MQLRSKTVRRLSILGGVLALILILGLGLYLRSKYTKARQLAAHRTEGLAAFAESNFSDAAWKLAGVVEQNPGDAEAVFALASSRAELATADGQHLSEARKLLRNLVIQQPADLKARHKLMEVYERCGQVGELLELANDTLKLDPKDVKSLTYRVRVFTTQGKYAQALDASLELNTQAPGDVQAHIGTLTLMQMARRPIAQVISYAERVVADHPGDDRMLLVQVWAKRFAGDIEGAEELLERVLEKNLPNDSGYVRELVRTLDSAGRFDKAEQVLESASLSSSDPEMLLPLIERLWQSGRFADVAERLTVETRASRAHPDLVAYHAMSLFSLGQQDAARRLLKTLQERKSEPLAQAWFTGICTRFDSPQLPLAQSTSQLRELVMRYPQNGLFMAWYASNLARGGELDQAVAMWTTASRWMPGWALPSLEMSQALLAAGRVDQAWEAARVAYQRQPEQHMTFVQLAAATHLRLRLKPDEAMAAELLRALEKRHELFPNDPATLAVYVGSLARSGQTDKAIEKAKAFLGSPNSARAVALEQLMLVSDEFQLGLAPAIAQRATSSKQFSPQLALAVCRQIASRQGFAEARQVLSQIPRDFGSASEWGLTQARFEESASASVASALWKKLATDHADELAIQLAVLEEAASVRADRAFVSQTIDRVRKLSGEDAQRWRLERARWLLEGQTQEQIREATSILSALVQSSPDRVDVRVLLSQALVMANSLPTAIEHLRDAIERDPSAPEPAIELARLYVAQGRRDDSERVLNRLASYAQPDSQKRLHVCMALVEAGKSEAAVDVLERARDANTIDPDGLLLLAELKASAQKTTEAAEIFARLVSQPHASPAVKVSAATFLRRGGDIGRADQLIEQVLQDNQAHPSVKTLMMLAQYYALFNDAEQARAVYRRAVQIAPTNIGVWRGAVLYELSQGQTDLARQWVDLARRSIPGSVEVEQLGTQVRLFNATAPEALRELAKAVSGDPNKAAQARAIQALADASGGASDPAQGQQLADALAELARQYPAAIALQDLAIQQMLLIGRSADAADLARRLVLAMPTNSTALRLAANASLQSGRVADAQDFAARWRASTQDPAQQRDADFVLAWVLFQTDRAPEARDRILPHLGQVTPEQGFNIQAGAAILAKAGGVSTAARFLEPLVESSPGAQTAWMELASSCDDLVARRSMLNQLSRINLDRFSGQRLALAGEFVSLFEASNQIDDLNRGIELAQVEASRPGNTGAATLILADARRRAGDIDAAVGLLEKLVESNPNDAASHNLLAFTLLSAGRVDARAEALARKAVELAPASNVSLDTLARVLKAQGRLDEAAVVFDKALELDRDYLDALIGLAVLRQREQRTGDAQDLVKRIDTRLAVLNRSGTFVVPSHLREELAQLRQSVSELPGH